MGILGPRRKGEGGFVSFGFFGVLNILVLDIFGFGHFGFEAFRAGGYVRGALGAVCFGLVRKTVQAPGRNLHP